VEHGGGRFGRLAQREGVQRAQRIEQKRWLQLGFQQLQLGVQLPLLQLLAELLLLAPVAHQLEGAGRAGRGH
jgi:hypothetical protein